MTPLPRLRAQPPPADPHELARQILSGKEFHLAARGTAPPSWWDILAAWLRDRFAPLLHALGRGLHWGTAGAAAGDLLVLLVVAVVVTAIVLLLRNAIRPAEALHAAAAAPRARAEMLFRQAADAAERAEYRAAIALVFRASLAALDMRGVVEDEPSITVNEYRREIRRRAASAAAAFEVLARSFTATVYADRPADERGWESARDAYLALVEQSHVA